MNFKQTKFLSNSECARIAGTPLMEKMTRNRWSITMSDLDQLMKTSNFDPKNGNMWNLIWYLDERATGLFNVSNEAIYLHVYFENPSDSRLLQDL